MRIAAMAAAGLVLTGCGPMAGGDSDAPVWAREATIEAIGRAYVELAPNRASFTVTYESRDADAAAAPLAAVARGNLATEAIREIGGENVRVTSNLNVNPYYEQVTIQVGEDREQLVENRHPDSLIGYVARVTLSVEVLDVALTSQVRGAALALGPVTSGQIGFTLDPSAETQRLAFAAAVDDATARAQLVADASGQSLGGILVLREGNDPCLGRQYGPPGEAVDRSTYERDQIRVTGSRLRRDESASTAPIQVVGNEEALLEGLISTDDILEVAGNYSIAADMTPQRLTANVCAVFGVN